MRRERTSRVRWMLLAAGLAWPGAPALADSGFVPDEMMAVNAAEGSDRLVATDTPNDRTAADNTDRLNRLLERYGLGGSQYRGPDVGPATIYVPAGTYYFDDTVHFAKCKVRLLGAGAGRTRLVLVDNASGFSGGLKPFVRTASCEGSATDGNGAHDNIIEQLTIDVGRNAEAVGLRFLAANFGLLSDVTIRAPSGEIGSRGLELSSSVGPAYIKNVMIEGFDVGIYMDDTAPNTLTFVEVTVAGQGSAGLVNDGKNVTLESFTSRNNDRAIVSRSARASMVLLDGWFEARGGTSSPAIELQNGGMAYLRRIETIGYGKVLANAGGLSTGALLDVAEWSTHDLTVRTSVRRARTGASMELPLSGRARLPGDAPDDHEADPGQHFVVRGMDASEKDRGADEGPLLDSLRANRSKTTADVPQGHYSFRSGITIGDPASNLRKIDFNWSYLSKASGNGEKFEVVDGGGDYLIIENLYTNAEIVHRGAKPLILRNIKSAGAGEGSFTVVAAGLGTVFVENAATGVNAEVEPGATMVLRGIDRGGNTTLRNRGGRLTVVGDNVEIQPTADNPQRTDLSPNPQIITRDGGTTLIFGGAYDTNAITRRDSQGPLFIVDGANACIFVVTGGLNRDDGDGWGLWPWLIDDNGAEKDSGYLRYAANPAASHRRLVLPPYRSSCL